MSFTGFFMETLKIVMFLNAFPTNIYLFKVKNRYKMVKKGMKYVQSFYW